MIRLIAVFAALLAATVLLSQEQSLLDYVPKDVDGFVCFNAKGLLSHPKIKEYIDSPAETDKEFIEFKKTLSDNGVDIYNALSSGVIYFRMKSQGGGPGAAGGILKTSINEALLKSMLEKDEGTKGKLKSSLVNGKTVYSVASPKPPVPGMPPLGGGNSPAGEAEIFFSYAAADIVVVSDKKEEVVKTVSAKDSPKVAANTKLMGLCSKIDKKSMLWGVCQYNPPEKKKEAQNPAGGMQQDMLPVDSISGGSLAVNFTGEKKDTVSACLKLSCKEKEKAQMLAMQMQGLVMIMLPTVTQGNPQLETDLNKAISFKNDENDIVVNLELTNALIDMIKKTASEPRTGPRPTGLDREGKATPPAQGEKAPADEPVGK